MDLLAQFQQNWQRKNFTPAQQVVLLAVSGGIDSMVMADLFHKSKIPMAIAHCNFQLRGEEADKDEQLVKDWAMNKGITFHSIRFDTKQASEEWKKGTQETARILRYEWLDAICKEHKYAKLATAHHANDNAETLLMHFFKGTGISGLHGIPEQNGNTIRPLLFTTRAEIKTYAAENKIEYREDASNATDAYLRNDVRLNIIPAIEKSFPNLVHTLNDNIGRFAQAEELYKKAIAEERKKLLEQRGHDCYIPVLKLKKRMPLETITYELFAPFGFGPAQVPHIIELLSAESGRYIKSDTHRIIRNRDFLVITTLRSTDTDLIQIEGLPCTVSTGKFHFSFSVEQKPDIISTDSNTALIDMKRLEFPILLRKWKLGDYFYPLGMGMKKKKLSRFLIDNKVAIHDKEHIWVLECSKRIAWIAGMRLDERFKITDSTEHVLKIVLKSN